MSARLDETGRTARAVRVVACSSEETYRSFEAPRDAGEALCIPVLGRSERFTSPASLLGVPVVDVARVPDGAPLRDPPSDEHLVAALCAGSDHMVAVMARMYAAAKGRRSLLADDADALLEQVGRRRPRSLTVICLPRDALALEAALAGLWRHDPDLEVGVMTARDLESLSWMLAKSLIPPLRRAGRRSLVVGFETQDRSLLPDDAAAFIGGRSLDAANAERWRLDQTIGALAISAHGKEDYVHIGMLTVCGLRSGLVGAPASARAPQCAFGAGCCKPGRPAQAHTWPVDAFFINSCSSAKVADGLYEGDFSLPLAAADGPARLYIGTRWAKRICSMEHWLFTGLWHSGYRAGEIVAILNHVEQEAIGEAASYLLVGDPLHTNGEARGGWVLEAACEPGSRPWPSSEGRAYYGLRRAADDIRLYLVDGSRDPRVPEVQGDPFPDSDRDRLAAGLDGFQRLSLLIPDIGNLEGRARELVGRARRAARLKARARYDASCYAKARRAGQEAMRQLHRMEQDVVAFLRSDLRSERSRLEAILEDELLAEETRTGERCSCGAALLVQRTRHPAFSSLCRRRDICLRCSVVQDAGIDGLDMSLEVPFQSPITAPLSGRLLMANLSARRRSVFAIVGCPQLHGRFAVEPDVLSTDLAPQASQELRFRLTWTGAVAPHSWMLRAFVTSGMEVSMLRAAVQLVPGRDVQ
ncbi:MAG TPA: hypothetical protein VFA46_20810 [Actinomycetes bacterium]|jgi:hypothetical protein|nr:hypothetical protein [Actinomycetes bacterium]